MRAAAAALVVGVLACGRTDLSPVTGRTTGPSGVSTGGSASGTTSGSTTGGCQGAFYALGELQFCGPSACGQCGNGLACDPLSMLCERTCHTSAECPALVTACNGMGLCAAVPCNLGGRAPSQIGQLCLQADSTVGSCLLDLQASAPDGGAFLCTDPGTASGPCLTTANRQSLGQACPLDQACGLEAFPGGATACALECDPSSSGESTCAGLGLCRTSILDPRIGYCAPATGTTNGTTSSGQTSGGTTGGSTGATTGATTTGGMTGGLCVPELTPCSQRLGGLPCNCGLSCVADADIGVSVCEKPCQTTGDCPGALTVCSAGTCTLNLCGGPGESNGTLDGTCNSEGSGDGTCIPTLAVDGGTYGLCEQGGTASNGSCTLIPSRSDPAGLCPAGNFCGPSVTALGQTSCYQLCNPANGLAARIQCALGGHLVGCFQLSGRDPALGVCF